jgi:tRNA dimethylallyltransferase
MQVYGVLDRLTARPAAEDLAQGAASSLWPCAAGTAYSTGIWLEQEASEAIAGIRARGAIPVVVGGTGLYFPRTHRRPLRHAGHSRAHTGSAALRGLRRRGSRRCIRACPARSADGRPAAPGRPPTHLAGAGSGHGERPSITEFQGRGGPMIVDPSHARCIVLDPDRLFCTRGSNARFCMVEEGALDEVRALLSLEVPPLHPAMKAIGVRQLADYLAGHTSLDEAIELSSAATRQYAKRQMTWFRNQLGDEWQRTEV